MAVYYPSGCEVDIPDYTCDPCEALEKGRIGTAGFIKTSFEFTDPSNPTEWQAGINSKDIIVIPEVVGSFDGGTEVEGPGYGRQATKLLGYNFTSNFRDPNYKRNVAFYNLLKNSRNYRYFYVTETQVHITDNPVSIIPKTPVTEDLNSDVAVDVTVKWDGNDMPLPYDAPAGIFGTCFTVAP